MIVDETKHVVDGTYEFIIQDLFIEEKPDGREVLLGVMENINASDSFANIIIWLRHYSIGVEKHSNILLNQFIHSLGLPWFDRGKIPEMIGCPIKATFDSKNNFSKIIGVPYNTAYWKSSQVPQNMFDGRGFGSDWESTIKDDVFKSSGDSDWPDQKQIVENHDVYQPPIPVANDKIKSLVDSAVVYQPKIGE